MEPLPSPHVSNFPAALNVGEEGVGTFIYCCYKKEKSFSYMSFVLKQVFNEHN